MQYPELIELAASRVRKPGFPEATPEDQTEADQIFQQMYFDCVGLLREGQEGSLNSTEGGRMRHIMVGIPIEEVVLQVHVSVTQIAKPDSEIVNLIVDQIATTRGYLELTRERTDLLRMGRGRHGDKGELLRRANLEDARQFSAVVDHLKGLDLRTGSPIRLA